MGSSEIDSPAAIVRLEDSRGTHDCVPVGPVCAVALRGESPGNWTLDTYQRLEYAGAAPNSTAAPAESAKVSGNDLYVPDPVLPMLTDGWQAYGGLSPAKDAAGLNLTRERTGVYYFGPAAWDPAGAWGRQEDHIDYSDQFLGYDRFGPYNEPQGSNSDKLVKDNDLVLCFEFDTAECYATYAPAYSVYQNATPNVTFGLEWYNVDVATTPAALRGPTNQELVNESLAVHGLGDNATAEDVGHSPRNQSGPQAPATHPSATGQGSVRPPVGGPTDPRVRPSSLPLGPKAPKVTIIPFAMAVGAGVAVSWFIAALYGRLRGRQELLANARRKQILEFVTAHPGQQVAAICRALDISRSSLLHHVRYLQGSSLVRVVRQARFVAVFPEGFESSAPQEDLALFPLRDRIMKIVKSRPTGVSSRDLERAMPGIPKRTRNHNIARLIELGHLLREERDGASFLIDATISAGSWPARPRTTQ